MAGETGLFELAERARGVGFHLQARPLIGHLTGLTFGASVAAMVRHSGRQASMPLDFHGYEA